MSDQRYTVRHRSSVYSGFVKLDLYEATVAAAGRTVAMVREVHDHGHGATVLPYDPDRRTCLLVRQLRVPVHLVEGDGLFLETAAGLMDPTDADGAETARREAREELGYHVHDLEPVTSFFSIPGLVTEVIHAFLGTYGPGDRIEGDLGADEDEVIDVEEWALSDLWRAFEAGRLRDVKAIVCLQALKMRRPELFG